MGRSASARIWELCSLKRRLFPFRLRVMCSIAQYLSLSEHNSTKFAEGQPNDSNLYLVACCAESEAALSLRNYVYVQYMQLQQLTDECNTE